MSEPRSRAARQLAEQALVHLVSAYGEVPKLVLLGGLVPDLLCSSGTQRHIGTTDVDVQANLEIAAGAVNGVRLEEALREAGFRPDNERVWRWSDERSPGMVVKVEFLADRADVPNEAVLLFEIAPLWERSISGERASPPKTRPCGP